MCARITRRDCGGRSEGRRPVSGEVREEDVGAREQMFFRFVF